LKTPIKWVGSKKKLIKKISEKFPQTFNNYFELFAGSAVMFFYLEPKNSFISDSNEELINFYKVLKDFPEELIGKVLNMKIDEENYYQVRNLDREKNWPNAFSNLDRASRFLFLNRTCFNGIWRVNSSGFLNVPYGKKTDLFVDFKPDTLRRASVLLKNTNIFNNDFEDFLPFIKENDLIYLDPPYAVNENSGESSFTKKDF
jgi:DNA adenine methylase